MDLKIKSNKSLLLHAVAKKADGTPAEMSTISFKVEQGTAQLSDGPSGRYKIISIADPNPTIIRVDANVELDPKASQKILTSRLFLNSAIPAKGVAPTPVEKPIVHDKSIPVHQAATLFLTAEEM